MAKKVSAYIKLQVPAGQANPSPPVGPALGQHGVNIMEFCKAYNAATESQRGNVIPVEITLPGNRKGINLLPMNSAKDTFRITLPAKPTKVVLNPGWSFKLMTILTLTTGTAFVMWLGEQMTERGVGNGISLIIFAGIVARLPNAVVNTFRLMSTGEMPIFGVVILLLLMVLVVAIIIFVEQGQRRIPVQYAKRVVGRKMYGSQNTYLPFKLNPSGVIPVIFANAILILPFLLRRLSRLIMAFFSASSRA